jgi:hypothetical protein
MSKGKIFTAQEVQAILSGNKTMFREICKRQPQGEMEQPYVIRQAGITEFNYPFGKIPYQVGQKIFVKESFNIFAGQVAYKQSLANAERYIWKPAKHMKQEHSRLTLQIKEIRVEKLQDINEEDCINEGFDYDWLEGKGNILIAGSITNNFAKNWNSTHKKEEHKWESNPFVWSIQFEVVNE